MIFNAAYMLINKAIPNTGGPYTVRFYDENGTLIQTDANVPQNGRASCTLLDGTFNSNLEYFKGWNPAPDIVVSDMECFPVYGDYIISHEEIHDSWETICADNGAHYPLGAYKSLVFDFGVTTNDVVCRWEAIYGGSTWKYKAQPQENYSQYVTVALDMVKVAEAEDGSTSTWISTGCIVIPNNPVHGAYRTHDNWQTQEYCASWVDFKDTVMITFYSGSGHTLGEFCHDWGMSRVRSFLNGIFFDNMPQTLKNSIKSVNKSYWGITSLYTTASRTQKTSIDKIWVPSVKELNTTLSQYTIGNYMYPGTYAQICEDDGIDYASVYEIVHPGWYITRSVNSDNNRQMHSQWIVANDNSDSLANLNYIHNHGVGWNNITPFGFCL